MYLLDQEHYNMLDMAPVDLQTVLSNTMLQDYDNRHQCKHNPFFGKIFVIKLN
jgi:hypothetical protein